MTPLVDVVMVILIFLMLVGTFASAEFFLKQRAGTFEQATSSDVPPPPGVVPDEPIIIRVSQPSPDRFVAQADKIQTSSAEELHLMLDATRKQLLAVGKSIDQISIVISPQNNVKHRHYVAVYEAALRAGFTKVSFAVAN
jgi:biopolymer transport protein ExbD